MDLNPKSQEGEALNFQMQILCLFAALQLQSRPNPTKLGVTAEPQVWIWGHSAGAHPDQRGLARGKCVLTAQKITERGFNPGIWINSARPELQGQNEQAKEEPRAAEVHTGNLPVPPER